MSEDLYDTVLSPGRVSDKDINPNEYSDDEINVSILDSERIDEDEETDEKSDKKERKRKKRQTRRESSSESREKRRRRRRSVSTSSSVATYEDFELWLLPEDCPYSCQKCNRGFYTKKELAEHEIDEHDNHLSCVHCHKKSESVTKLAAHILFRHPSKSIKCYYCDKIFATASEDVDQDMWEQFRHHVGKELLKTKMEIHGNKYMNRDAVGLRGVGKCKHGAPVRCKNFPKCPGARCIYSHGSCKQDKSCTTSSCPYDHSNRPRQCMACLGDRNNRKRD